MFEGMAIFPTPIFVANGGPPEVAAQSCSRSSALQFLHPLRQRPERAIKRHILVDAVDGAGLCATDAAFGILLTTSQPALGQMFLNDVERAPEVLSCVFAAAGHDDLIRALRRFHPRRSGRQGSLGMRAHAAILSGKRRC